MSGSAALKASTKVSVVIPTTLRPELGRAVQSVLIQSVGRRHVEVVVVVDAPAEPQELRVLRTELGLYETDIVVATGGGRGGGAARRLGTELATGDWTAYLDDDDEWHSNKLADQLAVAGSFGASADKIILSCRVWQKTPESAESTIVPLTTIRSGQQVAEYLFHRRRPSIQRASLYTSTFLAPSTLARAVSWRSDLRRHQDWDWIMRAENLGATVVQLDEPLVTIWTGTNGSISASSDWESSLSWATDLRLDWPEGALADFLTAQTLRYALHARSPQGVRKTILAIAKTRQLPSFSCLVIAAGGLVNRQVLEKLLLGSSQRQRVDQHSPGPS